MNRYFLLILPFLAGCANSTSLPPINGKQSYFVECGGNAKSWVTCYERAAKLCNGSYSVINKEQGKEASIVGTNQAFSGSAGTDRSMTISCKN